MQGLVIRVTLSQHIKFIYILFYDTYSLYVLLSNKLMWMCMHISMVCVI